MNNVTLVTGMWDIGRESLNSTFSRSYSDYWTRFIELLVNVDTPMAVFVHPTETDKVLNIRGKKPTIIIPKTLEEIANNFDFSDDIEKIRTSDWGNEGWVKESPQKKLKYYNLIVMSKMFFLNDAAIINHFNTTHFYWIDGGITNTVPSSNLDNKHLNNLAKNSNNMLLLSYPYNNFEVHGMSKNTMIYMGANDNFVCRGGFFGGSKQNIAFANGMYYDILKKTVKDYEDMGTEENILTIMAQNDRTHFDIFELNKDGLVYPFFDHIKTIVAPRQAIYITTYNAPQQLKLCLDSIIKNDYEWLENNCDIFIINNSTCFNNEYNDVVTSFLLPITQYNINNCGINGARQFAAEHFYKSNYETYVYFEDDMIIDPECHDKILDLSTSIVKQNHLDYIKLSYEEVYGDNGTQWAWYNVPDNERPKLFPDTPEKPINTYSLNAPKTKIKSLGTINKLMYAIGNFHYCNWPIIFTQEGNKKMFIDTKWEHPFEQTWMAHAFSLQLSNTLKSACLLSSPIIHQRSQAYTTERKEN